MIISKDQVSQKAHLTFNKPAIILATIFSYVFHPLFIPIYITWYLTFINDQFFIGMNIIFKYYVLVWVIINMFFFPAMTVLLLKGVGFIDSVFLRTKRDRIIPYIAANLFYFWMFLVFHNKPQIPLIITSFVLGVFITSSVALLMNIYFKISMHALGMGGAVGLMLIILFFFQYSGGISLPTMITILVAGIVCTSRMIISDHSLKDICAGFFVGIVCQFVASAIIL